MSIHLSTGTKNSSFERIYSSESPLRHPRTFCRNAISDLVGAYDSANRLFRRSLVQRYRHSSLGLFWAFAPSLITALTITAAQRANLSLLKGHEIAPQFYAIFGIVMAQSFLEAMNLHRSLFSSNRHFFNRHRTAIEGFLLAGLWENMFGILVKLPILAAAFIYYDVQPALTLPLGIISLVSVVLFGASIGIFLAPWNTLKQDVENIMNFFPWILFGVTPVFVQPRVGSGLAKLYHWNPLSYAFDTTRALCYGNANGHLLTFALFCIISLFMLPSAWLFCRVARPYVIERFLI